MGILLALSVLVPAASLSHGKKPSDDAAFAEFWARFKSAVAKDDREAVADMTRLPFMLENRDLGRAEYVKKYPVLFDRKTKRCFAAAKPSKDGEIFQVFCGQQIFQFEKVEGKYRFTEIGVND
jgi:hypothetical protein